MGMYVNPGNEGFERIVSGEYVDKTRLIALVNRAIDTSNKLICCTRPRRFGKTFAAESLVAYYSCGCDSRGLFAGLDISRDPSYEQHLNAYNVVHLDMTAFRGVTDIETELTRIIVDDLRSELPEAKLRTGTIKDALLDVTEATGRRFVFIIDEWDAPLRERRSKTSQEDWIDCLHLLFNDIAFSTKVVAACYMTGILPIVRYGTQSALSDFREYTFLSPDAYAPYVGFSEGEVEALAARHNMDMDELRRWYYGYELEWKDQETLEQRLTRTYAPFSVMRACEHGTLGPYWTCTESFSSLLAYTDMDFDGLQQAIVQALGGATIPVRVGTFSNDMHDVSSIDDVLTLLCHLGHLAYDASTHTARVPNEEVGTPDRRSFIPVKKAPWRSFIPVKSAPQQCGRFPLLAWLRPTRGRIVRCLRRREVFMNSNNRRRRRFLIILVVCILLAGNILLGFILTLKSSAALTSLIQGRMLDVSNTAASMIDGDALAQLAADDTSSAAYQQIFDTLGQFQDHTSLHYVYCIRETDDGQFVYVVDPAEQDAARFGDAAIYTEARARASRGTPSVDQTSYQDAWGNFYSSYSPVYTSTGEVAGLVAVDFEADWYDNQIADLMKTVAAVATLSLLVGVLFVLTLSRKEAEKHRALHAQLNVLALKVEELVHEIDDVHELPQLETEPARRRRRLLHARETEEDIDALGEKVLAMQDEIRAHIERIQAQAFRDGLTGLGNKAAHLEAIRHLDEEVSRGNARFAVAVFDLNGLKQINDTYGHECGDLALTDAADRLRKVFGEKNLYRVGGDEFIALVDPSNESDIRRLMSELDALLAEANEQDRPYVLPLALSKGAAVFVPEKDDDYQAVFRRADRRMYDDKAAYYTHAGDRRRR